MSITSSPFIDAHAHLQDPRFAGDLDQVVARMRPQGIAGVICNGTSEKDWPRVRALAERYPEIFPCYGVHPWFVVERSGAWREALEHFLGMGPAGVGEIGLDRWMADPHEPDQEEVFRLQLRLARQHARPAMIHCLRAWDWLMRVLREEMPQPHPLLIHAYGGPLELVAPLTELGAYFSFAANILEPRKSRQREVLKQIPRYRLLLETDAPDMPPPPEYRLTTAINPDGSFRNEPANLLAWLPCVAAWLGEPPETLAAQLRENAERLLGLKS